jgi:hypothetical protein
MSFAVDEVPELARPGTHRIWVEIRAEGSTPLASPGGPAPVDPASAWDLFELVVRRDDSYVGYLTELIGAPFVFWPVVVDGRGHQTDHRIGADCAAVVVYGQRRLGRAVRYVAPPALHRLARPVSPGVGSQTWIREGDILHFGFQTAVVSRDLEPVGELDEHDLIIHSYHGLVDEVPFASLPYGRLPFVVLRWPE